MQELFKEFDVQFKSNKISFTFECFAQVFCKYNFFLINSKSDFTSELDYQLEQKIKESQDIVVDEYEDRAQMPAIKYIIICIEKLLIVINEKVLSLLDKYISINTNMRILFLKKDLPSFQYLQNEPESNKKFIEFCFEDFRGIELRSPKSIKKCWFIIKRCMLMYLLKKSYHKTFNNRVDGFSNDFPAKHSKLDEEKCVELQFIDSSATSAVHLFYSIENELLFIGKKVIDAFEDSRLQEREIKNLSGIHHPFLPQFYGVFESSGSKTISIEYINGVTLNSFIRPELSFADRMKIIVQIMFVIEYLHDHEFIYRDLKPNNVMIDKNGIVVLIDFDRMLKSDSNIAGTTTFSPFAAPEVLQFQYKKKSDIFSLGLMIYYILTGEILEKSEGEEYNFERIPNEYSATAAMCGRCTKENPDDRPSITEVIVEFYVNYYKVFGIELFDDVLLYLSKSKNPHSQCELGVLYYEGRSIPQNERKAFILFSFSASYNNPKAQHFLGLMYYEGNDYFIRNTSVAYQYFSLSSQNYPQSKHYCDLIQENSKSIQISFQELPSKFQSMIDNAENPTLRKIFSNFRFLYLPLNEIYSKQKNVTEQLIESYLLSVFKEFNFIVYEFVHNFFLTEDENPKEKSITAVICVEGFCFIIQSIDEDFISKILFYMNSKLINLTGVFERINQKSIEIGKVKDFINDATKIDPVTCALMDPAMLHLLIEKETFFNNIMNPAVSYLIRRYSYPSYYFKDSSFFTFNHNVQADDIIKRKLKKFLFSKMKNHDENDIQFQISSENHYIYSFKEEDFITLRGIKSTSKASYYLVMHIETLFIFAMKKYHKNQPNFKHEVDFCSNYSHRCMTKFYGFVKNNDEIIGFIYEYMCNGNLYDHIRCNPYIISPTYSFNAMNRIFQGIDYLHRNSLIHLGLNSRSILIDHDFIPFISKFELIRKETDEKLPDYYDKELLYMSPEEYNEKNISFTSMIYSFGRMIYLLFEKSEFCDEKTSKDIFKINNPMKSVPREIEEIYQSCIKFNEKERINHDSLKGIISAISFSPYFIENYNADDDDKERIFHEVVQYFCENIVINNSTLILSPSSISLFIPEIVSLMSDSNNSSIISNTLAITIPSGVTLIEENKYKGYSSLIKLSFEYPSSVLSLETSSFEGCSSLTKIIIPASVTKICGNSFKDCSALTQINIPSSVEYIGPFAFYQCASLVQMSIPSSVKSIGYSAFSMCKSLIKIIVPSFIKEISSSTFQGCASLSSITIPSSVAKIGGGAFAECSSLREIKIPSLITSIETNTFQKCSSLRSITIPSSVTKICKAAFSGCSSLKRIEIPSSIARIEKEVFAECTSLIHVILPSTVISIEDDAFNGCSSLQAITIPPSVTKIGAGAFSNCSSLEEISVPPSVTSLGEHAFSGCSSLRQVSLPPSVKSIKDGLFNECASLPKITIPPSIKKIKDNAFSGCKSLTELSIPSSVEKMGEFSFSYCTSLEKVTIPSSVTTIEDYAFAGCSSLAQVEIPSSVSCIGSCAFSGCSSLTQIIVPSSVTSVESGAFSLCSSLRQISIPASLSSIENDVFSECASLAQVEIPPSVASIGDGAFSGCKSLKRVTIHSSLRSIGCGAFQRCFSLSMVSLPSSVTNIEDSAFPSYIKVVRL